VLGNHYAARCLDAHSFGIKSSNLIRAQYIHVIPSSILHALPQRPLNIPDDGHNHHHQGHVDNNPNTYKQFTQEFMQSATLTAA